LEAQVILRFPRAVGDGCSQEEVVMVNFLEYVCIGSIIFCFAWITTLNEKISDLQSRLSVLTSMVLGGMTPDQVAALKGYNIEISQREPKKRS
jgi:hypothetical protein